MSTPTIMQRLGNKAKHYWDMAKTLPLDDSTTAGLRAVGENVSGRALAKEPAKDTSITPSDMLHPMAKYGSRPGEVRLDEEGNPTKAQPMKVMDDGGDIPMPNSTADANSAAVAGLAKTLNPNKQDSAPKPKPATGGAPLINSVLGTTPQASISTMPDQLSPAAASGINDLTAAAPNADQGADVDVHDGLHQIAILKAGEKVLNPEEADAYRAGQSAGQNMAPARMQPLGQPAPQMRTMDEGGDVPVNPVEPVMPRRASVRETIDSPETLRGISSMYREAQPSFARQTGSTRMPEILEPISNSGKLGSTTEGDRNIMPNGGMRTLAAVPNDSLGVVHSHPY